MTTYMLITFLCAAGWCGPKIVDTGLTKDICETLADLRGTIPGQPSADLPKRFYCVKEVKL